MEINASLPPWCAPYMELGKYRYKVAYGGRGGAKTTSFARILVLLVLQHGLKVMCCRQFQSSIDESVKGALEVAISQLGLGEYYKILDKSIETVDGRGVFTFKGIERNIMSIKGWEGYDICWIEEANTLRADALELLRPTIRKPGSELWFSFNRHKLSDAVDKFFLGAEVPDRMLLRKVNYYDNPFFTKELDEERRTFKRIEESRYAHVWLGEPDLDGDSLLIPQNLVLGAIEREPWVNVNEEALVMGVDPARLGGDRFCICYRRGRTVVDMEVLPKGDLVTNGNRLAERIGRLKPVKVFIDVGGLGVGVADMLRYSGFSQVVAVNFGGKPRDGRKYYNKRAEMYGLAREWFEDEAGVSIDLEKGKAFDLMGELSLILKDFTPSGVLKLQSKEKFKKDGIKSPDMADAFVLTFAQPVGNMETVGITHRRPVAIAGGCEEVII